MDNQRMCDSPVDPETKSMIKPSTGITGNISGPGDLFLDGRVTGDIAIGGLLFIGESGAVQGKVEAGNMILAGQVKGRVTLSGNIEIRASATIQGNIVCQKIAIAEGATLDGEVHTKKGKPLPIEYFTEKRKELLPTDK